MQLLRTSIESNRNYFLVVWAYCIKICGILFLSHRAHSRELFSLVFVCRRSASPSTIACKTSPLKLLRQIEWNFTGGFLVWPSIYKYNNKASRLANNNRMANLLFCFKTPLILLGLSLQKAWLHERLQPYNKASILTKNKMTNFMFCFKEHL